MSLRHTHIRFRGFTLVELMIALLLGLIVVGVATYVYLGNRVTTNSQRDVAEISQSGSLAIDMIARMFRQAGHVAINGTTGGTEGGIAATFCSLSQVPASTPSATASASGGFLEGWDNKTDQGYTVVNSSDMVVMRFDGSSQRLNPGKADESIVDCFGKGVVGPTPGSTSERSWTRLFVANDPNSKNPALYCEYKNSAEASPTTYPLIDNVESFQVLYGLGALYTYDGTAKLTEKTSTYRVAVERYLPASSLTTAAQWNNVVAVRFGVVVAGERGSRTDVDSKSDYNVFGAGYGTANGATFDATTLSSDRRLRPRRVFSTTVELKNAPLYGGCNPA